MISGILKSMRTPFARPPGRVTWRRRLAPEMLAVLVYAATVASGATGWLSGAYWAGPAACAAGHMATALVTLTVALVCGSLALAGERDRGTADALILACNDHRAMVRGRFWCMVWPWLRFFVYLLPLYLFLSASLLFRESSGGQREWLMCTLFGAFGSRPNLAVIMLLRTLEDFGLKNVHAWGLMVASVRWLNDIGVFLFACAAAYYISARAPGAAGAMLRSSLLVPLALVTFLGLHEIFVSLGLFELLKWHYSFPWIYGALALQCVTARTVLTWLLLRRAAGMFGRISG
jgi:hypothetical protein